MELGPLAEKMNVSRTPIREAIRKLANEGLVVIEPRHGAYVSETHQRSRGRSRWQKLWATRSSIAAVRRAMRIKQSLQKLLRLGGARDGNGEMDEMVEYDVKLMLYA